MAFMRSDIHQVSKSMLDDNCPPKGGINKPSYLNKKTEKELAENLSSKLTDSELFDLVYNLATIANMKGVHFPGGLNQEVDKTKDLIDNLPVNTFIHKREGATDTPIYQVESKGKFKMGLGFSVKEAIEDFLNRNK